MLFIFTSGGVYLVYCNIKKNKKIRELENKLISFANGVNDINDEVKQLNGIFEIHITIDPENNFVSLLSYIKNNERTRNMKCVFAVSNKKNNQYMLSHFTRKENEKEAIDNAMNIADEMKSLGMKVIRVKVEGHNVKNTPITKIEYQKMLDFLSKMYNCSKPYFEFHVKISDHKDKLDYSILEKDISKYDGVAISYNISGRNCKPLLTLRIYDEGFLMAQNYKDTVLNELKTIGYVFENAIQQEFSIWDTNQNLDNDWLIGKNKN